MLNVRYFASVREAMQREHDQIELPGSVQTVTDLKHYLAQSDSAFSALISGDLSLLVAVNQTVVDGNYKLSQDDEVAFFPPMTGG